MRPRGSAIRPIRLGVAMKHIAVGVGVRIGLALGYELRWRWDEQENPSG